MSIDDVVNDQQLSISYSLYEQNVPIEVLLELCSANKVDIRDIFVSNITSEFLKYIKKLQKEDIDYDEISTFLVYAAQLIEIKSKRLLPLSELADEEISEIDASEELIFLKAEEYKILQEASLSLSDREILHRFYRDPEFDEKDTKLLLKDSTINNMIEAFKLFLEQNEEFQEVKKTPKIIKKDRFSVPERIESIAIYAKDKKEFLFSKLLDRDFSKTERITTFLAILELTKLKIIKINQEERDILVKFNDEIGDKTFDINDMFDSIDSYE